MACVERRPTVVTAARWSGRLVALDGLNDAALNKAAKARLEAVPKSRRGGVSRWDASGVFEDLRVAGEDAGHPSARTLLLLYAADLAFRLRWEIRPALAEGRTVAAAPYVATAVAFGRAAGLPAGWLKDLFAFAMRADATEIVDARLARRGQSGGFIDFGCDQLVSGRQPIERSELAARVSQILLRTTAPRASAAPRRSTRTAAGRR